MFLRVLMCEAAYITLNNVYTIFEFLFNLWVYLNRKFVDFSHGYTINDDYEYVFKNVRNVGKVPTHLTILLANEKPSYKDLSNLVMWSIASGIPFISFYDHKGILKKSEAKFQEAIERRKRNDTHIVWHNSENACKNGIIGRKIHIRTLSISDGRQSVTGVAKQFISSSKGSEIDQQMVDSHLKDGFAFPDPDLGLYCGKVFSVYGYPPWQIRTTEFVCLGTHYDVKPHIFVKALYRYSKTEQRLGK